MITQDGGRHLHIDVRYSGTLENYGSHAIDLVRWFAAEIEWVEATELPGREPLIACGGEGFLATICQVDNQDGDVFDLEAYTASSRVTVTSLGEQLSRAQPEAAPLFAGHRFLGLGVPAGVPSGMVDAMLNGAESLVAHLSAGTALLSPGSDGLAALLVQEAMMESGRLGGARVEVRAV